MEIFWNIVITMFAVSAIGNISLLAVSNRGMKTLNYTEKEKFPNIVILSIFYLGLTLIYSVIGAFVFFKLSPEHHLELWYIVLASIVLRVFWTLSMLLVSISSILEGESKGKQKNEVLLWTLVSTALHIVTAAGLFYMVQ